MQIRGRRHDASWEAHQTWRQKVAIQQETRRCEGKSPAMTTLTKAKGQKRGREQKAIPLEEWGGDREAGVEAGAEALAA